MHKSNKAVRFKLRGIIGTIDENNWVLYGNCGFHLEGVTEDSKIRKVIEETRSGKRKEPRR